MPIYEYVCEACGQLTELIQRVNDPTPACPSCGASRLTKRISRTSFQLKGGGWYADLYSSPGSPKSGTENKKPAEAKPQPASKETEKATGPAKPGGNSKGA